MVAGFYYIDPNQGSSADALLAYCNFSEGGVETCLHPRDSQVTWQWLGLAKQGKILGQSKSEHQHIITSHVHIYAL